MTPPLTRETLAEIRRLRDAEVEAFRLVMSADPDNDEAEAATLERAIKDSWRFFHRHFDALLAAAERGLDVEGGR